MPYDVHAFLCARLCEVCLSQPVGHTMIETGSAIRRGQSGLQWRTCIPGPLQHCWQVRRVVLLAMVGSLKHAIQEIGADVCSENRASGKVAVRGCLTQCRPMSFDGHQLHELPPCDV